MFIIPPAKRSTLTSGAIDQWHVGECYELLIWFFIDHEWEMGEEEEEEDPRFSNESFEWHYRLKLIDELGKKR
jgi:hypothetical protein